MVKEFNIQMVVPKLSFTISEGVNILELNQLLPGNPYGDEIDFDVYLPSKKHNLQREFCWTLFQKQQLILSIVKGISIPTFSIIRYKDEPGFDSKSIYKVIDGKQRLSAIMDFMMGKFPISVDGEDYFISNFDAVSKRKITNYSPKCNVAYEYDYQMISDDEKIAWLELLNFAGTPMDLMHIQNLKNGK